MDQKWIRSRERERERERVVIDLKDVYNHFGKALVGAMQCKISKTSGNLRIFPQAGLTRSGTTPSKNCCIRKNTQLNDFSKTPPLLWPHYENKGKENTIRCNTDWNG